MINVVNKMPLFNPNKCSWMANSLAERFSSL